MLKVLFSLGGIGGTRNLPSKQRKLGHLLVALVAINDDYLQENPRTPKLYNSGVKWTDVWEKDVEDLADIPTVLARGGGDCDDLACWRVAELRAQGIQARPALQWRMEPDGRGQLYHVVVEHPDGSIEDPSRRQGMGRG